MRITENDRKFGPIIYGPAGRNSGWAIHFNTSVYEEENDQELKHHNHLWVALFGWIFYIPLGSFIKPYHTKIVPESWDEATIKRLGRNWYWDCDNRRYGISKHENHVSLYYGRQSGCSNEDKTKGWFLPWGEWQIEYVSYHHADGTLHAKQHHVKGRIVESYDEMRKKKEELNKLTVTVKDYDNQIIQAHLHIEERKWNKGRGSFAWLKYFVKPMVRRVLQIEFDKEVGTRKGSWKGGLLGTSIDLEPGEESHQAFIRYCKFEHSRRNRHDKLTIVSFDSGLTYKEVTCPVN